MPSETLPYPSLKDRSHGERAWPDRVADAEGVMLRAGVRDMACIRRPDTKGCVRTIIYYVAQTPLNKPLQDAVRLVLTEPSAKFCRMTAIPSDDAGAPDLGKLSSVPVLDDALVQEGQARISALLPGLDVVLERAAAPPMDHVVCEPDATEAAVCDKTRLSIAGEVAGSPPRFETLADALTQAARGEGSCGFVSGTLCADLSYADLFSRARAVCGGLTAAGFRPGDIAMILAEDRCEFLEAFWGAVLAGGICAPVAPPQTPHVDDPGVLRIQKTIELLDTRWVLAGDREAAQLTTLLPADARILKPSEFSRVDAAVDAVKREPDDAVLILLTSGSTGTPKAVVQNHRALLRQIESSIAALELTSADVTLNWFGFDHVGGISMFHIRDVVAGCRQLHASTSEVLQEPVQWLNWVGSHRVSVTWAPNFAFGLVTAALDGSTVPDLSSLRVVMNAGEAINRETAERFARSANALGAPLDLVRPAWGMSETSSAVTYARFDPDSPERHVSVGAPVPGIMMRIANADDEAVPEGQIGRLQVCGEVVTRGYYRNADANTVAFTSDGWLRTGDLAFLMDGKLTITGRENDAVIINGRNIYAQEVETEAAKTPGVDPSQVVAVAIRGRDTEELAIFFEPIEPERADSVLRAVRAQVLRVFGVNPRYVLPISGSDIPRTSIGKVQRSALAAALKRGDYDDLVISTGQGRSGAGDLTTWLFQPAWRRRGPHGPAGGLVGPILVLGSPEGATERAVRAAAAKDAEIWTVQPDLVFAANIERGAFRISPDNPDHYQALVSELARAGVRLATIVHGLASDADQSSVRTWGFHSIRRLCGALDSAGLLAGRCLRVITRGAVAAEAGDEVDPDQALVRGFAHCLSAEHNVDYRQIDLPKEGRANEAELLELELAHNHSVSEEVALRANGRWIPCLTRFNGDAGKIAPISYGGLVVVSGGRGGVGREVVGHLVERFGATVVTLGRDLDRDAVENPRVRHLACDVTDRAAVAAAVASAERMTGEPLGAVIHLAGAYGMTDLAATDAEVEAVLSSKVDGADAILAALSNYPKATLIFASSVVAVLRGAGVSAYSAANAYVEACAQRECNRRIVKCVAWSLWDNVGMARQAGARTLMLKQGYRILTKGEALQAFDAALQGGAVTYAGLNSGGDEVAPRLAQWAAGAERLALRADSALEGLGLVDDFGVRVPVVALREPMASEARQLTRKPPQNDLERQIADVWTSLLDRSEIGRDENFFDLGGTSLEAARLLREIQARFGGQFTFASILTYPTVASLAAAIEGRSDDRLPEHLVPLQPEGSLPPFYGVHPLFGLVYPYAELARQMPSDQPFFALQARGFAPGESPYRSIEALASAYLAAIRKHQPHGPYFIGGWSLGSLIAFEMAQMLMAEGEAPGALVIIDQATDSVELFLENTPLRVQWIRFWEIVGAALGSYDPYFRANPGLWAAVRRPVALLDFVRSTFIPMVRIALVNKDAAVRYKLRPYPGQITLLHTGDPEFTRIEDPRLGWDKIAAQGVDVHLISGSHLTLHEPPHVFSLAEKLVQGLAAARASVLSRGRQA